MSPYQTWKKIAIPENNCRLKMLIPMENFNTVSYSANRNIFRTHTKRIISLRTTDFVTITFRERVIKCQFAMTTLHQLCV